MLMGVFLQPAQVLLPSREERRKVGKEARPVLMGVFLQPAQVLLPSREERRKVGSQLSTAPRLTAGRVYVDRDHQHSGSRARWPPVPRRPGQCRPTGCRALEGGEPLGQQDCAPQTRERGPTR